MSIVDFGAKIKKKPGARRTPSLIRLTDTVPLERSIMLHFAASKAHGSFFLWTSNGRFQNQMTHFWDFTTRKDIVDTGASKERFTPICRVHVEIISSS